MQLKLFLVALVGFVTSASSAISRQSQVNGPPFGVASDVSHIEQPATVLKRENVDVPLADEAEDLANGAGDLAGEALGDFTKREDADIPFVDEAGDLAEQAIDDFSPF